MITLACNTCGTKNEFPESMRGKQVECTFCFAQLKVPIEENGTRVTIPGFDLIEPIGAGAVGRVYLAEQQSMGRRVALKIIPRDSLKQAESGRRFNNEVRLLAKLDHPNIIAAYESGETDDFYYLAMSYIDGETLDALIHRRGFMPEDEALSICYQIAQALAYAWSKQQLLHRDIKPANIMISRDGEVKLMDLGISKTIGHNRRSTVTATGMVVGTPYYMSPEQAVSSQNMDRRSDIYSLGATLYELVTGTKPFQGDNPLEVMGHHRFTPLPSVRNRNRKVSEACELLLEVMMAKDMADRYQSWEELLQDITRVINGQLPSHDRPADAAPRLRGNSAPTQPRLQPITPEPGKPKVRKSAEKRKPVAVPRSPSISTTPTPESASNFPMVFASILLLVGILAVGIWLWYRQHSPPAEAEKVPAPPPTVTTVAPPPKPVVQPTTTVIPPAPAELQKWKKRYAEAAEYWRNNPSHYQEARQRFEMLLLNVPDTQARKRLEVQVQSIDKAESEERAKIMRELRRQAQHFIQDNEFELAVQVYLNYDGFMANETADRRSELAEQLLRRQRSLRLDEAINRSRAHDLSQHCAFLLANGKVAEAARVHAQGADKLGLGGLDETQLTQQLLAELQTSNQQILESFKESLNQEIQLELTSGTVNFIIQEISDTALNGLIVERQGSTVARIKRQLALDDLSPAERSRHLSRNETPSLLIARGLLALEAKRYETAHKLFGQVPGDLPLALQGYTLAAAGESGDHASANAFAQVMQALGSTANQPPVDLVRSIWQADIPASKQATLSDASVRLRLAYGPTAYSQQRRAALDALRQLLVYRRAVAIGSGDDAAVRRALTELARLNPGVETKSLSVGEGPEGFFVSTGKQGSLEDISPLMGLPIKTLDLSNSSVKQLDALRGMPLGALYLANTPVSDLSPLRGMPLRDLDLSGTQVTDLKAISGLPLRELNLQGLKKLTDLSPLLACTNLTTLIVPDLELAAPLSSLPNLKQLGTSREALQDPKSGQSVQRNSDSAAPPAEAPAAASTPPAPAATGLPKELATQLDTLLSQLKAANPNQAEWLYTVGVDGNSLILNLGRNKNLSNLEPLTGKSISQLILDETGVEDLAALHGLPLTQLSLRATNVKDLTPLRGMALTHLDLAQCPVKEIFPLFSMKLVSLDISGTKVKDLGPLAGMPLANLRANTTDIRDLAPIKGKMELEQLDIANTQVRDFSVLDDLRNLHVLKLSNTRFEDVGLLESKKLNVLHLDGTKIDSISVLAWMPLVELQLHNCDRLQDLSPLMSCQDLERLTVPRQANVQVLRKHPKLKAINFQADPKWEQSAESFWEKLR